MGDRTVIPQITGNLVFLGFFFFFSGRLGLQNPRQFHNHVILAKWTVADNCMADACPPTRPSCCFWLRWQIIRYLPVPGNRFVLLIIMIISTGITGHTCKGKSPGYSDHLCFSFPAPNPVNLPHSLSTRTGEMVHGVHCVIWAAELWLLNVVEDRSDRSFLHSKRWSWCLGPFTFGKYSGSSILRPNQAVL